MLVGVYCFVTSFLVWRAVAWCGVAWVELVIVAWSKTGYQHSGMVTPLSLLISSKLVRRMIIDVKNSDWNNKKIMTKPRESLKEYIGHKYIGHSFSLVLVR